MWVSKWWQNLDLLVNYAFKAKDATKVCFHTNKLIVCKRDMLNCAPGFVLHDMRKFTLSSDFYFKAIQNKKTGRAREKQKDGKDTRQTCHPQESPPHSENSHIPGACRGGTRDRQLALLFLKPLNNNYSSENKMECTLTQNISCWRRIVQINQKTHFQIMNKRLKTNFGAGWCKTSASQCVIVHLFNSFQEKISNQDKVLYFNM